MRVFFLFCALSICIQNVYCANVSTINENIATSSELPPNCKIIISSITNGAEFPLTNIIYTIAIVDNSNTEVNANQNVIVNYNLIQNNYLGAIITPNVDYNSPTTSTVTILSGTSTATLTITVMDDDVQEDPEQLTLELNSSSDTNYPISTTLGEKRMDAYIIDNDKNDTTVTFSKNDYRVNIKIPEESAKGTLPSCFTRISFYSTSDFLPTATHPTIGSLPVSPAYDPNQLLKVDNNRGNSSGKYTLYFYTRNNLKQATGHFDLIVAFTNPITFTTLGTQQVSDNICDKTYTLPEPMIADNPSCNRQVVINSILFDRSTEVVEVNAQNREYTLPYGSTQVTYNIKETIQGCIECNTFSVQTVNYTFTRVNTGAVGTITIPDLNIAMNLFTCKAVLNTSTLPTYQANIGCQKVNLTLDPASPTEFTTYGEHTISYNLVNSGNGATVKATRTVVVADITKPQIALSTNSITVKTGLGSCTYSFQGSDIQNVITVTDTCNSTPNIQYSINNGSILDIGTHPIMVWALDAAGNTSAKRQVQLLVQRNDINSAPDFKNKTIEVFLEVDQKTVNVDWEEPTLPACYNISLQKSHEPKDSFTLGKHKVVYTYRFPNGENIQKILSIDVKERASSDALAKIKVYKAFSPNNDGKNDYWHIEKIEPFRDNIVNIYNETGKLVFQAQGYDNRTLVWRGINNLTNSQLPKGLYFYQIKIPSQNYQINGSILLFR